MDSKYRSRKFALAVFFTLAGTAALFLDKLTGGEYVTLTLSILSAYGLANVMEAKQ